MVLEAEEIKQIRNTLGFTQEEFAHQLGVTLCTLNRWENGKSNPSKMACILIDKYVQDHKEQLN